MIYYLPEELESAISNKNVNLVKKILEDSIYLLNSLDKDGLYPIHNAIKNDSIEILDILLSFGDDIDKPTNNPYQHYYTSKFLTPLSMACEENNINIVKYLINKGANINNGSLYNRPLSRSINNIEISKYLIEQGAEIEFDDYFIIFYAIENQALDFIKLVFSLNIPFNLYKNNTSILNIACRNGNYEIVSYLIDKGFDVNEEDKNYDTPLITACYSCNLEIVKLLVDNGANPITKRTIYKYSNNSLSITEYFFKKGIPLKREDIFYEILNHRGGVNYNVAKFLVEKDLITYEEFFDKYILKNNETHNCRFYEFIYKKFFPVEVIASNIKTITNNKYYFILNTLSNSKYFEEKIILDRIRDNIQVFNLLELFYKLDKKYSEIYIQFYSINECINFKGLKTDLSLLYESIINYKFEWIKPLLENGDNPNLLDKEGISLLLLSFYIKNMEITELLLKYGADINIKNYINKNNNLSGNTILIQAVRKRFDIKTINYILEKGADINLSNNNGETPLHTICMRITKSTSKQDIEILETLLKYGADITAKTINEIKTKYYTFPKGSTPLDIIKIKNARAIENILKNHLSKL